MKVGIIGSGLGGLLSAVSLAKKGHNVVIFEKLPYPGGRFTNLSYKGFQLSTGALHMLPHGNNGPLAKMLDSLGIKVRIIPSNPFGTFMLDGKYHKIYQFDELLNLFSIRDKMRLIKLLATLKFGSGDEEDFHTWLKERINHPLIFKIADSFCGFALSIHINEIASKEMIAITKNIKKFGGPGVPRGGCKAIIDALVNEFEMYGKIIYKAPIEEITVEDGKVKVIATAEESHAFDIVVSDIGPKSTIALCGEENFDRSYIKTMGNVREVGGIKISIACKKPMIGHTGILFTPKAERIDGANEVTNADPTLAPKGKHLLMTHQALSSKNVKKEIKLGIEDLHNIFPDFDRYCDILMVQTYRGAWPVNRAPSGKYINPVSPIKGLYFVGDSIKPQGWMESEGVAKGVEMALSRMEV